MTSGGPRLGLAGALTRLFIQSPLTPLLLALTAVTAFARGSIVSAMSLSMVPP